MATTGGITRNPKAAPQYSLYRELKDAPDVLPGTTKEHGVNMEGHTSAHIQIVPSGGCNPTVQVLWWSEEAGRFVQEHTPISKAGVGINVPYEFTVECKGRIMLVAATSGVAAGHVCKILIAGHNEQQR